ncbi:DnaJ domain-containing protein [Amylostereum chailletii]|nr:DnaJ domain-containing protein [Amylostereum chailletii]
MFSRRLVSLTSSARYGTIYEICQQHLVSRPGGRFLSTSSVARATHYDTLAIPQNASKSQIKSNYYKLSKQYHPDINKSPDAKEKFHAFSAAYAVLGDDRQRRAYDRSLSTPSNSGHSGHASTHTAHGHPHQYQYPHWSYETRRRGATHAWERRNRPPPGPGPQYTHANTHPNRRQEASGRPDPFSSPHVRRATGVHTPPRTGWKQTDEDKVTHVSSFSRALQVAGIVVFVSIFTNGITASAA